MKCHYVYDEEAGKVLIPGCTAVALSGDISLCTCSIHVDYKDFEKSEFKVEVKRLNGIIEQQRKDIIYLENELERHVDMLNRRHIKQRPKDMKKIEAHGFSFKVDKM